GSCREKRIDDIAGPVADGKNLACLFALERDAEVFEEGDGVRDAERAQDLGDTVLEAVEVLCADDFVRDVASSAAGDEDLRADLLRAVDCGNAQRHAPLARGTAGGDGGHESGGSSADYGEVEVVRGWQGAQVPDERAQSFPRHWPRSHRYRRRNQHGYAGSEGE